MKLLLSEDAEWEETFHREAKKAVEIKTRIENPDREIDRMVYALYGWMEEKVKIVEG